MTGQGYKVETSTLRAAGNDLSAAGDRLGQEWEALAATVQGLGAPWGGDEIGMLIGESYNAIHEQAAESFGGAAQDLTSFGEKLNAIADNYDKADEEMSRDVNSVAKALNGI